MRLSAQEHLSELLNSRPALGRSPKSQAELLLSLTVNCNIDLHLLTSSSSPRLLWKAQMFYRPNIINLPRFFLFFYAFVVRNCLNLSFPCFPICWHFHLFTFLFSILFFLSGYHDRKLDYRKAKMNIWRPDWKTKRQEGDGWKALYSLKDLLGTAIIHSLGQKSRAFESRCYFRICQACVFVCVCVLPQSYLSWILRAAKRLWINNIYANTYFWSFSVSSRDKNKMQTEYINIYILWKYIYFFFNSLLYFTMSYKASIFLLLSFINNEIPLYF